MTETCDAPWPRPDGRVTNLPRALILDLDDTILDAYGNPSEAWLRLCHEFAGQLGGVAPKALHAAILEARDWVWSDPERARDARLDLWEGRRQVVRRAFVLLDIPGAPDS